MTKGATPKLSCMLWTLEGKASLDSGLEIVAEAGYQGVELVGEFQKWSPAELRRVVGRLRALGLTVDAASGVKAGFAVPDPDGSFVAQVKAQLASMRELGCRRMILLSGPVMPGIVPETQRQIALENLTRATDLAAAEKAEIVIEPIDVLEQPTVYLRSVSEAFALVQALRRPEVKVLYDLYHEQRGAGNLIEKLEANLDLVGLLHVADVPGRHEPGTGEINFPEIYRRLAHRGYAGWIAMEFYPTGDPVTTLRAARFAALQQWTRRET
ncbi:MAG: TIM barrel protein [Rhodospirillales bacterium]|nr:TIM barrel protein [Acetobacter sp.]